MKLDPRHLLQLAVILDSGTLRAAAVQLGTTQPALSRTIALMEERIGTPLFQRRRRPLTPTAVGLELAAFGRTIRSAIEKADGLSIQITAGQYGTIRVGAPPFYCDSLLSRIITRFAAERPQVHVVLFSHYFPALFHEILNHRLDMVIGPFELLERQRDLKIERLLQSRHVVVCRPGHKLLRRSPVTVADLQAAAWVGHLGSSVLASDMRSTLASTGVDHIDVVIESDSAGALITLVREGDYLTVLPLLSVVERVAAGELAVLPTPHGGPERSIGIITRADADQNVALTELRNALRSRIEAVMHLMNEISSSCDRAGWPRHRDWKPPK